MWFLVWDVVNYWAVYVGCCFTLSVEMLYYIASVCCGDNINTGQGTFIYRFRFCFFNNAGRMTYATKKNTTDNTVEDPIHNEPLLLPFYLEM